MRTTPFVDQAHRTMHDPWRAFVERFLPWYHPGRERVRDARTEGIRQRSIRERIRAERALAEYKAADARRK